MTRHARGILDTSVVIELPAITDPELLPAEPLITAVTLAELSVGPLVARDEQQRAARLAHLQQAEADFDPIAFDAGAARAFGRVAASLRSRGRGTKARAYDAMIAATALANELPLYTLDGKDFADIAGLEVVVIVARLSVAERGSAWLALAGQQAAPDADAAEIGGAVAPSLEGRTRLLRGGHLASDESCHSAFAASAVTGSARERTASPADRGSCNAGFALCP